MSETKLIAANLSEAILIEADLSWVELTKANLSGADLKEADLSGSKLSRAEFSGANLRRADLSNTDLSDAILCRCKMNEADLGEADLRRIDLTEADLSRTDLDKADLSGANLTKVNLYDANLSDADLRGANLSNANLSLTNFSEANLSRANLSQADLRRANIGGAYLNGANLCGASVKGTIIGWTNLGNVDLSKVKGLESVEHRGPSTIGIDTLYRSKGKIPEVFLRGAGVDDTFINHNKSLEANPIGYYSCFISYSSKDQDFAERLYADLQQRGVRCWFAQKDMKIGDRIRSRIDKSIRTYDKLLIVLSKNSIESQWVEKEVETAFEEERTRKKTVLFPVRLDSTVMYTEQAWAKDIRLNRHIGDFTKWKDHDKYQQAFNSLLGSLKADIKD